MDATQGTSGLPILLLRLFGYISLRRRYQFVLLLFLTLVSSLAEVVSLGAVVPFIGILTQPERVLGSPVVSWIARLFGISASGDLVLALTAGFALAALLAGGLRLLLLGLSIRLANATGADLSVEVYRRTLYQPYCVHVARNSSEIISGITQKVVTATAVLTGIITVVTSAALAVAIVATLGVIQPVVAAVSVCAFGASYAAIACTTRRRLMSNGECIAQQQSALVKCLQEGLGAIRDVLVDGSQAVYCRAYDTAVRKLQRATGTNYFITTGPRYAMESLGMMLVAALAYILSSREGGVGAALPVLGALALAAQRLLPLVQQLYGNWSFVTGSQAVLSDVLELLEQALPADVHDPSPPPLVFKREIRFDNVWFRYASNQPWVVRGISLNIRKGARIGFVGKTGSGKSTVVDLMMCLLEPTQGKIFVDGQVLVGQYRKEWQAAVAHVPQSIYLADATIAENIAFGVPLDKVNWVRVREAATQAQITDFVDASPKGYDTLVGERGVRLSGGQRQRIGIARALYRQAAVLILDEATSALDSETERAVMATINELHGDLTILIVAHRLSTLHDCEKIVDLGVAGAEIGASTSGR
jgi:ATP-binding cassette, subfamily B, bacterial PglK